MGAFVGPLISLASGVVGLIASEQARANLNDMKNHQLELISEDARGDDRDMGKIEALHKQIVVLAEAIANEYAQKTGAPTTP